MFPLPLFPPSWVATSLLFLAGFMSSTHLKLVAQGLSLGNPSWKSISDNLIYDDLQSYNRGGRTNDQNTNYYGNINNQEQTYNNNNNQENLKMGQHNLNSQVDNGNLQAYHHENNLKSYNMRFNQSEIQSKVLLTKSRHSESSSSPVEPIKPLMKLGKNAVSEKDSGLALPPHPVFDKSTPKNVTAIQNNPAYLHCVVDSLGNKSVSWIRQRDIHILTVDIYTYTTDQRFEVIHSKVSKDWILKIKYAQLRDSGKYECQISSKPVNSYVVNLNVFAPKAAIIGAPDMHVDEGSTINLTCIIEHSHTTPNYIFWYHDGEVVNYDSPRGGINVLTERGNTTKGYLLIQDAKSTDSGNYSCKPSNTGPASLRVHVLHGELPAAMQTSGGEVRPQTYVHFICLFFVLYFFIQRIDRNIFGHSNT